MPKFRKIGSRGLHRTFLIAQNPQNWFTGSHRTFLIAQNPQNWFTWSHRTFLIAQNPRNWFTWSHRTFLIAQNLRNWFTGSHRTISRPNLFKIHPKMAANLSLPEKLMAIASLANYSLTTFVRLNEKYKIISPRITTISPTETLSVIPSAKYPMPEMPAATSE